MTMHSLLDNIVTAMKAVNDGATPTAHVYADHVWLGMPNRLPMGDHCVMVVEPISAPNFYYKMCASDPFTYDIDVEIIIANKGEVTKAYGQNLIVTEAVINAISAAPTFSGACVTTTIESVEFGDVALSEDTRNLVRGSRVIIRCKME